MADTKRGSAGSAPATADVWDEERWRRSARRWRIAGLAVLTAGACTVYAYRTDRGPRVPSRIFLSVAGPDVRIVQAGSFENRVLREQPEDLLVEVGGTGDPVAVLTATLASHGWQVDTRHATLAASGGQSYLLTWLTASDADSATDAAPLSAGLDRSDPRRLLVTIGNPVGLDALASRG